MLTVTSPNQKPKIEMPPDFDRAKEIKESIVQLKSCFFKSHSAGDFRAAVAAQTQLNKLMGLYAEPKPPPVPVGDSAASVDLDATRAYLAPLFETGDEVSTPELARRAVAEIVRLRTAANGRTP